MFSQAELKIIEANVAICKAPIHINDLKSSEQTTLDALLLKIKDRNVIITTTPGPFKNFDEELSERARTEWKGTKQKDAVGCSAQLKRFEERYDELEADIYAYNKHDEKYQCGPEGLCAKKALKKVRMISNPELGKLLGLPIVKVDDVNYVGRITIVKRFDGIVRAFHIPRSEKGVDEGLMDKHINELKEFMLEPKLKALAEKTQSTSMSL